jgi:glycosyltransferase involved in cell wall biosynthesis
MKITLISTVFPYPNQGIMFGIERHVSEYSLALKQAGHSLTVITTFWNGMCDAVVCLSEDGKKCLIEEYGVDSEKIYFIPHGVDLNVFKPSENSACTSEMLKLLYLGVLEKRKGVIHLLKAFVDCPDLRKRAYLEIAGAGSMRKKLESFVFRNGIQNRVKFLGRVDDATVPSLYRACDVFVFLTLQEGFGFPTIEAMAFGKPVIASRLPVLEEIMGFVETGVSESVAKAILNLADNPGLRTALCLQGRKKAETIYALGCDRRTNGIFV